MATCVFMGSQSVCPKTATMMTEPRCLSKMIVINTLQVFLSFWQNTVLTVSLLASMIDGYSLTAVLNTEY